LEVLQIHSDDVQSDTGSLSSDDEDLMLLTGSPSMSSKHQRCFRLQGMIGKR
jgi:hypothetical protein